MGIFSFYKRKMETIINKAQWELRLQGVDYALVRDEIDNMIRTINKQKEKKGEKLVLPKDLIDVWKYFRLKPCLDTAINLLIFAPKWLSIFEKCKPGRLYKATNNPSVNIIAKSILDAAHYCAKSFKSDLEQNLPTQEKMDEKYIIDYLDFIYFWKHLANRKLFSSFGDEYVNRFNEYLGKFVWDAIESTIGHWPQSIKDKTIKSYLKYLNDLDSQYYNNRKVKWDMNKPLDNIIGDSLLSILTRRVVADCGYEMIEYSGVIITKNISKIIEINNKIDSLYNMIANSITLESIFEGAAKAI